MGPCFHGFLRVLLTLTRRHSRWFYSGRSVVRGVKAQASCEPCAHANSISKVKTFGWDFVWQRREIAEDESNTRLLPFGLSAFPLTLPLTRLCLCFFPPSLIISIIIFSICWVMQTWREREPAWTAAGIYPNILLGPPRSLQMEPGLSTPEYPPPPLRTVPFTTGKQLGFWPSWKAKRDSITPGNRIQTEGELKLADQLLGPLLFPVICGSVSNISVNRLRMARNTRHVAKEITSILSGLFKCSCWWVVAGYKENPNESQSQNFSSDLWPLQKCLLKGEIYDTADEQWHTAWPSSSSGV